MEQKLRCGIHTCSLMPLDVDKHRCAGHNQRSRIFLFWFGMQAHRVISESVSHKHSSNLTAGSCCGPKKLRAGQGPAVHFAGVTVVSVTQARAVDVSVAHRRERAAAARITVAMSEAGSVRSHKRGAGWRRPPGNEYYVE